MQKDLDVQKSLSAILLFVVREAFWRSSRKISNLMCSRNILVQSMAPD